MRLPLLPGLLEDHHEQALRARQRRARIAADPGQTLRALEVMDRTIDRSILAAGFYGRDAHALFAARRAAPPRALPPALVREQRSAAVFLELALAVQARSPDLLDQVRARWPEEPRAALEALWFFPIPGGVFGSDQRHVHAVFEAAASSDPGWMPLAIQLAGLCDVKALAPRLAHISEDPQLRNAACVALARMGQAPPPAALSALVREAREAPSSEARAACLEVFAANPALAGDPILAPLLADPPAEDDAHLAWAIAASRHPRETCDAALSRPDVPASLRLRVAALTGHPDAVIFACAGMTAHEGPLTPAERDVLELSLGLTPAEARQEPCDEEARSSALRALLLRALRKAHVPLRNDADRCPWIAEEILASPASRAVRLRAGAAFPSAPPPLGAATLEVTHPLRRWLHVERAVLAGHPVGLQVNDVFRRQRLALMIAQASDELRD